MLRQQKGADHRYASAASRSQHETVHHAGFTVCADGTNTVIEKRLESLVEVIVARTRTSNSPYYAINPSGRVPFLMRDDDVGLEEFCRHLRLARPRPRRTDV